MDKFAQCTMVVADEAISHAGLDFAQLDVDRIGVIWGAGIGGLETFQKEVEAYDEKRALDLTHFLFQK